MQFPTSFARSLLLRCLSPFSSLLFSIHVKFPPLYHRLIHFPPYFHIICMRCQCALWTGSFDYCITYTLITCTLDLWKSIVCWLFYIYAENERENERLLQSFYFNWFFVGCCCSRFLSGKLFPMCVCSFVLTNFHSLICSTVCWCAGVLWKCMINTEVRSHSYTFAQTNDRDRKKGEQIIMNEKKRKTAVISAEFVDRIPAKSNGCSFSVWECGIHFLIFHIPISNRIRISSSLPFCSFTW